MTVSTSWDATDAQEIGKRIQHFRRKLNISKRQFAKLMHVSHPTIIRLEAGKSRISFQQLHTAALVLTVSLRDLVPAHLLAMLDGQPTNGQKDTLPPEQEALT